MNHSHRRAPHVRAGVLSGSLAPLYPRKEGQTLIGLSLVFPSQLM